MTQREALDILKTGRNVFITGPAGSGKTYVVNQYIKYLKDHNVPIGVTASTGIAATHMGGVTIHAWSGISVKDRLTNEDIEEIGARSYIRKKIEETKVLIIDEVSMLHHFRFDMINRVLQHIKKSSDPFGGIQVVLCGDFFQLPPVSRMGEPEARFIYESDSWKNGKFAICYLSENYRQSDDVCLSILNEIRSGEVSYSAREKLMTRYVQPVRRDEIDQGDFAEVAVQTESDLLEVEPTRLFTHNIDVDVLNDAELQKVSGSEMIYEMTSRGRKQIVAALMKSCLAPEKLRLKRGARVMCVKNNFEKGYVNGTLGVVVSCGYGVDPTIRTAGTPDFPDGRLLTIERATWCIEDEGKTLAEINQYPLRLAWAITVHKSQGMSLDAVEVDLSKSFEPGMGYVALSRVRTLNGLKVLGINENALKVHPGVLEYDNRLRELSEISSRQLESFDSSYIEELHKSFLAKVAPLHSLSETKNTRTKSKKIKISTYAKTASLIKDKKSLGDIAKERAITVETVLSQIEKMIEGAKEVDVSLSMQDVQYLKKDLSQMHFFKISQAFEKLTCENNNDGLPPLSPIKSRVGANISWNEIRLARILLGYIKKKV